MSKYRNGAFSERFHEMNERFEFRLRNLKLTASKPASYYGFRIPYANRTKNLRSNFSKNMIERFYC